MLPCGSGKAQVMNMMINMMLARMHHPIHNPMTEMERAGVRAELQEKACAPALLPKMPDHAAGVKHKRVLQTLRQDQDRRRVNAELEERRRVTRNRPTFPALSGGHQKSHQCHRRLGFR